MAAIADGKLHFPSREVISAFLAAHPHTSDLVGYEKRIHEAVARTFANSTKVEISVRMGVVLSLQGVNENLNLPTQTLLALSANLTQALIDCANGKEIQFEKSEKMLNLNASL